MRSYLVLDTCLQGFLNISMKTKKEQQTTTQRIQIIEIRSAVQLKNDSIRVYYECMLICRVTNERRKRGKVQPVGKTFTGFWGVRRGGSILYYKAMKYTSMPKRRRWMSNESTRITNTRMSERIVAWLTGYLKAKTSKSGRRPKMELI